MKKKLLKCYTWKDKHTRDKADKRKANFSLSSGNDSFDAVVNNSFSRNGKRKKHNDSFKENCGHRATYVSKPIGVRNSSFKCSSAKKENKVASVFDDWDSLEDSPFSKLAKTVRKDPRLKFVNLSNFPSKTNCTEDKFQSSSSGCLTNSGGISARVLSSTPSLNSSKNIRSCGTPNRGINKNIFINSGASNNPVLLDDLKSLNKSDSSVIPNKENDPGLTRGSPKNIFSHSRTSNVQSLSVGPESLLSHSSLQDDSGKIPNGSIPTVTHRRRKNIFIDTLPSPILNSSPKPFLANNTSQENHDNNVSTDIIYSTPIASLPVRKWSKTFKKRRHAILLSNPPLCKTSSSNSQNSSSHLYIENRKEESENSGFVSNTSECLSNFISSPWTAILSACNQNCPLSFTEYLFQRNLVTMEKVGEGVFSEVFGCLDVRGVRSVWKIQPFEGDLVVNGEEQKKSVDILTEIHITQCLSNLRYGKDFVTDCFVESLDFKCVHGPYPDLLLELWKNYDNQKGSENDCPSVFSEKQLMLMTELEYAGVCMEDFLFASSPQAISVFFQVAHALAVAEVALEFEHRDLHWGNIMISRTNTKYVTFRISGEKRTMETKGVIAKIVDFTLSRALVNGQPVFADLALMPDIFESTGEYQFDIYRLMKKYTENTWSKYIPYTNVLWLHYLVLQMCKAVKYRYKTSKIHKQHMKTLTAVSSSILNYSSVTDFITNQTVYQCSSIERDGSDVSN